MKIILSILVLSFAVYRFHHLYRDYLNRPWIAVKAKLLEINIITAQDGFLNYPNEYALFQRGILQDDRIDDEYDRLDSFGRSNFFRHIFKPDLNFSFIGPPLHQWKTFHLKCIYEVDGKSYIGSIRTNIHLKHDLPFEAGEIVTIYSNPKNPSEVSYHQKHKAEVILALKYSIVVLFTVVGLGLIYFIRY